MTKEEAIKILTIDGAYLYPDRCYNYKAFELAIKALKNERPQGEWIKKVDDVGFVSYICNNCGFELELEDCSDSYFCSNCGADMREE